MLKSSFLTPWLEGNYGLPSLEELNTSIPDLESGLWLGINYSFPFHEVLKHKILGFDEAWKLNRNYFREAIKIAYDYDGSYLDHEDRFDILDKLGIPPDVSHPIYIITIKDESQEKIMYVGKSSSNKSRFISGHLMAIKLLNPLYNNYEKVIYFAQIMTYSKKYDYLPLEFVGDKQIAETILDDVESILIQSLKPKLNSKKTKSIKLKNEISIHIQNFIGTDFLSDRIV